MNWNGFHAFMNEYIELILISTSICIGLGQWMGA